MGLAVKACPPASSLVPARADSLTVHSTLLPAKALATTVRLIDRTVGEWSGKMFCWLIIPLVGGLTYEVIARYLFTAPTIWAYDITS